MRAAAASPPLSLPSTSHRTDVPEAEMPPRKRACFTTPAQMQIGREIQQLVRRLRDKANAYSTRRSHVRFEEAYDDRAYLRAREATHIFRDRPYSPPHTFGFDREAVYLVIACDLFLGEESRSHMRHMVRTLKAQVAHVDCSDPHLLHTYLTTTSVDV
ncbi:hypothetical protein Tco_0824696 [Tanacetum coccineum]|uniref:Uncharacterized protein n=1 Tax=Tanacetum coccineum TaxID=301880 RepID=A0ABQ5AP35_9ASTR